MSSRPYKPPPESFEFKLLKAFWTTVALIVICGFYLIVLVWPVSLLRAPTWVLAPVLAIYVGLCAGTYFFLKSTTLGKYLSDWPRYGL